MNCSACWPANSAARRGASFLRVSNCKRTRSASAFWPGPALEAGDFWRARISAASSFSSAVAPLCISAQAPAARPCTRWRSASARVRCSSRLATSRLTSASVFNSPAEALARPTARSAATRWLRAWAAWRSAWSCSPRTCSASFNCCAAVSSACVNAVYSLANISGVLGMQKQSLAADLGLGNRLEIDGGLFAPGDHVLQAGHHLVAALAIEDGHIAHLLAGLHELRHDVLQLFQLFAAAGLGGLERAGVAGFERALAIGRGLLHAFEQDAGAHAVLVKVAVYQQALEQLGPLLRHGLVFRFGQLFL